MQQQEHAQAQPPSAPSQARELTPGVTTNPQVMVGKPVIAGTRIPVEKITGALVAGETIDSIMYNYTLTREQIRAAINYAHVLVEEDGQRKIAEAKEGKLTPGVITNPRIMVGKPIIEGRRITVELIMDNLAAGRSIENVMDNYGLTVDQIRNALRYAHHLVYEDAQQKTREGGQ